MFQGCFQGSFNGVSRKFQGYLKIEECFKGDSMNYINHQTNEICIDLLSIIRGHKSAMGGPNNFCRYIDQNFLVLTTVSPVLTSNKCPYYPRAVLQGTTSLDLSSPL